MAVYEPAGHEEALKRSQNGKKQMEEEMFDDFKKNNNMGVSRQTSDRKIIRSETPLLLMARLDTIRMLLALPSKKVERNNALLIEKFKQEMEQVFEMTDLGLMNYFLGMEITQSQNEVFICQKKYAKEILNKIPNGGMQSCCYTHESKGEAEQRRWNRESFFSWCSKKQEIVAQSTAEAEFIAATAAVNQVLWIKKLMCDLNMEQKSGVEIFVDNQAIIAISNNPVFHGKIKHFNIKLFFFFNIKLFFLREIQENGGATLVYCKTEDQIADLFTKPLPVNKFELLRQKIGVYSNKSKEKY
ncbi:uncharacterized protein LOC119370321 [Jatropha curcas]|uniref:uncharacterized protein LOC119370321 n=1 Tax=Jatropha curcas TaxID=180498 RepID=UPI001894D4FE|nr:uncharacterized protein LOC119370321 [Jatropha curcas]